MSEELALAVKDAVSVVNDPHMGVSIVLKLKLKL